MIVAGWLCVWGVESKDELINKIGANGIKEKKGLWMMPRLCIYFFSFDPLLTHELSGKEQ